MDVVQEEIIVEETAVAEIDAVEIIDVVEETAVAEIIGCGGIGY